MLIDKLIKKNGFLRFITFGLQNIVNMNEAIIKYPFRIIQNWCYYTLSKVNKVFVLKKESLKINVYNS